MVVTLMNNSFTIKIDGGGSMGYLGYVPENQNANFHIMYTKINTAKNLAKSLMGM